MPPIPKSFDEQTIQVIDSLTRRAKDLSDFQVPRLRACTGPLSVQQQLAGELREDIDAFAQQLEALDVAVDDQRGEVNRRELRRIVTDFQQTLATLRKDTRAALLASKRAIDAAQTSNRDELFRGIAISEKLESTGNSAEDALMRANNEVTEALRRTMGLMQGELEKSVLTNQMLEDSSATLRSASEQHDTLTLVLSTSKQLITALEKADWLDRMIILSGLAFFVLVVLFIIKQRIVDRGLRIAFWWTRFLPDSSGIAALEKMEAGMVSELPAIATAALSSVAATASVALSSAVDTSRLLTSLNDAKLAIVPSELSSLTEQEIIVSTTQATFDKAPSATYDHVHEEL